MEVSVVSRFKPKASKCNKPVIAALSPASSDSQAGFHLPRLQTPTDQKSLCTHIILLWISVGVVERS